MGDEVQGMKAGVMELPDVFVLNKADLPDARRSLPMLRYAARAIATEHPKWTPPVIAASAASGEGVSELLAAVQSHREALTAEGSKSGGRETATQFLRDLVAAQLAESVRHRIRHDPRFEELVTAVLAGEVDLYSAAGLILEQHWPDGARQSA
jgi:LAO/AO transport system kinase